MLYLSFLILCHFLFQQATPLEWMTRYEALQNHVPRIIGGTPAPADLAPHSVALIFGQAIPSFLCGGSLITTRHVLTAAHCIDAVRVGATLLPSLQGVVGTNRWSSGGIAHNFTHHVNHPDYNMMMVKNDVGILVIKEEVILSDLVKIIKLGETWVNDEECYFAGWGQTAPVIHDNVVNLAPTPEFLQYLNVTTIHTLDCIIRVNNASVAKGPAPPIDGYLEICTLYKGGHGACFGDSGSALVLHKSGEQVGLVSWGFPCAQGAPDVHVRVTAVLQFIRDVVRRNLLE